MPPLRTGGVAHEDLDRVFGAVGQALEGVDEFVGRDVPLEELCERRERLGRQTKEPLSVLMVVPTVAGTDDVQLFPVEIGCEGEWLEIAVCQDADEPSACTERCNSAKASSRLEHSNPNA